MRKIHLSLVLAACLLIAVPVLTAGQVLPYAADFQDPASGWETSTDANGSCGYGADGYEIKVAKEDDFRIVQAPITVPDNFTVQSEIIVSSGSGIYGICFEEYYFLISSDSNQYYLMQYDADSKEPAPVASDSVDNLNPDSYHTLKLVVQGNQAQFYINGQATESLTLKAQDKENTIQIAALSTSADFRIKLKNFSVTAPNAELENSALKTIDFSTKDQGFSESDDFRIHNGVFRFLGGDPESIYWAPYADEAPAEFTLQTKVQWDGGKDNCGYGLIFRLQDDDNFYVFNIASGGGYQLARLVNDQWQYPVDWKKTNLLKKGFNTLKVSCRNKFIRCYINGQLVINLPDNFKGTDKMSVGVFSDGAVKCTFDDFALGAANTGSSTALPETLIDFATKDQGFAESDDFRIHNGVLQFIGGNAESIYWAPFAQAIPADFTVQTKVQWDGGADFNGFGLIFRLQDDQNFYIFQIAANGGYQLAKLVNDQWQYPVDWQQTDLLKKGFNTLKVSCQGQSLKCYLNGKLVIDIQDNFQSKEKLQVGVYSDGEVRCTFDDFLIKEQ